MDWATHTHYVRKHLAAGAFLFQEGDFGDSMFLVTAGRLQVSKKLVAGAEKTLAILGVGQYAGDMSLLTGSQRSATVKALEDTEVVEIDQAAFAQLLHDQPQIGVELMRQIAARLQETTEELILTALEMALAQRDPQRLASGHRRMRFVATGSFAGEKANEVLRIAATQVARDKPPALITSLVRPGRSQDALIYIIETDNPRDILTLVAPYAGLIQWDISPAIEVGEALDA